jgi:hypothetical protein
MFMEIDFVNLQQRIKGLTAVLECSGPGQEMRCSMQAGGTHAISAHTLHVLCIVTS